MMGFIWDENIAMEVEREEAQEIERERIAMKALAKGIPLDVIHDITGLDLEAIRSLQEELNSGSN